MSVEPGSDMAVAVIAADHDCTLLSKDATLIRGSNSYQTRDSVQLEAAIEFLPESDVLVVTKLDRLARSGSIPYSSRMKGCSSVELQDEPLVQSDCPMRLRGS